jgi:hypothetical protein
VGWSKAASHGRRKITRSGLPLLPPAGVLASYSLPGRRTQDWPKKIGGGLEYRTGGWKFGRTRRD